MGVVKGIYTILTASDGLFRPTTIRIKLMDPLLFADTTKPSDVAGHALSRPASTVATFSDLISQMSTERSSVTPAVRSISKPRSSPASCALPTEILLSIFQFVFEMCVDWQKTGASYPKHTTVWLEDDPLSPSLFPYSLASVCVRWLYILSSVPVYWTRQVITVDSRATSPIAIKTLLQWVGNLPLQLIITRHPYISGETDRDEHTRVQTVLDFLQPHIHQAWSLTFNVRHSSSLATLWREQRDAQNLRVLVLTSSPLDTSGVIGLPSLPEVHPVGNSSEQSTPLQPCFPEEVSLRGHLFEDAPAFTEQHHLWFRNITFLTIRGFTTSDGTGISLHKFIRTVQMCRSLQKLEVEDIAFVNDVHPSHRFRLEAPVVYLRKISGGDAVGSIISQTFAGRLKEVVTVSDCPFDGFGRRSSFRARISSISLILEGTSASSAAIQQLICFWNGENLSLINCPGVCASFLQGIPVKDTPPDLRRLRIVDCENVSAVGLIALVKSREFQSAIDALALGDPDDEPCTALVELHVRGRGPPIIAEQATWFSVHIDAFSWDTTASDGMRYTWNASTRDLIVVPVHD